MAVEIKHKFQSGVPDGPDTGFVRPSNWNDTHNISMAGERLLGKPTAGAGDAVEIGLGAGLQFSSTNITVTFGSTAGTAAEGNHTHPEATTSVSGFLSALDKAKLDGLAAVASSGSYNDLTDTPTLADVATTGDYGDLDNTPTLADVATTGDYGDLDNTPTLGGAAALNVGTSAGTVAAGDDSRITGALQTGSHAAVSVIGRSANSSGDAADIAAGANDRILARVSNALSWVQLTIGMIPDGLITAAKMSSGVLTTSPSNAQTANYTLALSDAGKTVRMSNSSARTITIPPNSSVAFPVDTIVNFETVGTGDCTIAAGSGVTIRSRNGLKLAGQYAVATAHKIATNEWILAGDLTS